MDGRRLARAKLFEQAYLALPLGFSVAFGFVSLYSGELLSSPSGVLFLLLPPVVGAAYAIVPCLISERSLRGAENFARRRSQPTGHA